MTERGGAQTRTWRVRGHELPLDQPAVAGILNVTPDSFSDGGRFSSPDDALRRAARLVAEGADLLDIGAESTRPGAAPVTVGEEWARLEPVLGGLRDIGVPLSVDTTKLEVAERAIDAGAAAINDVSGLRASPGLADLAARTGVGLVLMHMRGTPRTMQADTRYGDLLAEVTDFLAGARRAALAAGCDPRQVAIDPGIGFGKSTAGNLELIARLREIRTLGAPVWLGASRKSFLGDLLDAGPDERVAGTVAACLAGVRAGADVLRVHDVRAVRDALRVARAIEEAAPAASAPAQRRAEAVG